MLHACSGDDIPTPEPEPTPQPQPEPEPEPERSTTKTISAYKLTFVRKGVSETLTGTIDQSTATIQLTASTQHWIDDIEALTATFTTDAHKVFVNGVLQESGVTPNDFRRKVVYTATAEDGSTRDYTVQLASVQSNGLPAININTENGQNVTDRHNYINAKLTLSDYDQPQNDLAAATIGIRGRGNSTWHQPKKPYRIKFENKTSMFGLGAAKSWVLLANYQDPTFMTNSIAFKLAKSVNMDYVNTPNHVDLFLNGNYQGIYTFTEQVQVNKHRVNVDEKNGFLIEMDSYYDDEIKFRTSILGLPVNIKSPEVTNLSEAKFVQDAFNALEKSVMKPTTTSTHYSELIDVESLINYLIVYDVTRNMELFHPKSTFLHKDAGGKIKFGPVWDFDWAFGYAEYGFEYFKHPTREVLYSNRNKMWGNSALGETFVLEFFKDSEFRKAYKARWNEVKPLIEKVPDHVDELRERLRKSAAEDEKLWKRNKLFSTETTSMKGWLKKRIAYLDAEINKW